MPTAPVLRLALCSLLLVGASRPASAQAESTVPSPQAFFGFAMGTPRRLADWRQIVDYFRTVGAASPRVLVQQLGESTEGRPYLLAVISSADTIATLPAYQAMQHQLADPRHTSEADAERIANQGKVVVLVGANVHANEIGSSQMVNELLYRMAVDDSPWTRHVLDNVILLLVPSQNPDGQQMVVDWYRRNRDTPYEGSPLPELYQRYAGHDNNRDSFMLTQVETQLLTKLTYQDWLPEVYLDKHQMGNSRARIFVPPFTDPPNPNVDPLVWSEVNMLGQAMATSLNEAGKPGVIWGELYTGFWQGANSTTPWWHNMVALLTETASAQLATTVLQDHAEPGLFARPALRHDAAGRADWTVVPAPNDVRPRMNYPEPWLGGTWGLNDVVEYQLLATLGLLEGAANNRVTLKRNFYRMNRRTIDRFATGHPFAFVVPPGQRDPVAAAKLVSLLQAGAIEVHRARAAFRADDHEIPADSYVIRLDQPFGRWVKDLLEPQRYPNQGDLRRDTLRDRPYDVTAWSLGMLMGVDVQQIDAPFDAPLVQVDGPATAPPGRVTGHGGVFVLDHAVNNSFIAMNRLLQEGADVTWARDPIRVGDRSYASGAIVVRGASRARMESLASELQLQMLATRAIDGPALPIRLPRIALYEPWGGNMDAGWTRWVLEQHEFPYTRIRNTDVRRGELRRRFDVLILAEMTSSQIVRGLQAPNVRPEYRGGVGDIGVQHLREFVRTGGTLITLGNTAHFAIDRLGLPLRDIVSGLDEEAFFCPGSILKIALDTTHPIAFGMPETADAMFINDGGFVPTERSESATVRMVARYPSEPLLRSGLVIGDRHLRGSGAVLDVPLGRGRVIMHTVRVQHRGQTWGTFRLLLNSILYGPAMTANPMVETLEAAAAQ